MEDEPLVSCSVLRLKKAELFFWYKFYDDHIMSLHTIKVPNICTSRMLNGLNRGGVGSVQEAAVRGEPGGHRENDSFRQGAPEHERTPPPRVWQELRQQEDAQGNSNPKA